MTEATLVWTRAESPHVLPGSVSEVEEHLYRFFPDEGDRPSEGDKVILWLERAERSKLLAKVEALEDESLLLRAGPDQPQFRRYYPRVDTAVSLAYRAIDLGQAGAQYSKRQIAVLKSWWRPASPDVNLSADGLAFLSEVMVPVGARLNMKLRLPDDKSTEHSLTGDVVRTTPEIAPEGDEVHRLAVSLTWMSPATHQALIEYTARWQDETLEKLEPRDTVEPEESSS